MSRWLVVVVVLIVIFCIEFYAFQAIKTITKNKLVYYIWLLLSLIAYGNFFAIIYFVGLNSGQTRQFQYAFAGVLLALIPKLVILFFLFGEDVFRFTRKFIFSTKQVDLGRRKFIAQLALGVASLPLIGLIYAIVKGKYNFKVIKYQLSFDDLPEAFDGFTITHITDIHSGSFDNREKIAYAIDLINQQKSEVVLFTGDIVNNFADEMNPWIDIFKKIEAPMGKYSVLGNHDYGDYSKWDSHKAKLDNFKRIKDIHPKIGFQLLLNENLYIEKNQEKIALVGVENWGRGFIKKGNLQLASNGLQKTDFKILMSHDPSHWEEVIKKDDFNYQLTLSGHTHGMQFGIEIPGFVRWSPAQYAYKQWAGLYKEYGRYINVNRGFGYHAFPGRLGVWPEITVIELKKKK